MKILHVVPTYYPATRYGGPIRSVHGLASAQASQGHDIHVYTTNADGKAVLPVPLNRPMRLDDVNVWYFATNLGRRIYWSPKMQKALALNITNFDILHLHSAFLWPTTMAARAARKARIPYVLSPRGMLVGDLIRRKSSLAKRAWISLFERRNIEQAAAIHLTSETEASELRALGLRCKRSTVVPNGVDLPSGEWSADKLRARHSSGARRRPFVLFLGRLNWKKGLDRLIPAMRQVTNADLLIAGNDEEDYRPKLEALARQCGVADRVCFLGPVDGEKKWKLLTSAELLVLPSYSENFGNVVLEAMAVGRAVVVTPQVGLASVVREVCCGIVVDGEPATLGSHIKQLLDDHDRRRAMGEAGRYAAETEFNWKTISRKMIDVYAHALGTTIEPVLTNNFVTEIEK